MHTNSEANEQEDKAFQLCSLFIYILNKVNLQKKFKKPLDKKNIFDIICIVIITNMKLLQYGGNWKWT